MHYITRHPSYKIWLDKIDELYPNKQISIIDFGCGNGFLIDLLGIERISSYHGFDTSKDALRVANKRYKNNNKIKFTLIKPNSNPTLGSSRSADVLIMIGVLQYLTNNEIDHVIADSARVLKTNGYLISSTVLDNKFYRAINAYRFFFPNRYINRQSLLSKLRESNFKIITNHAKGIIIGPLFSHGLVIIFDAIDRYLLRVRGTVGPIGSLARAIAFPFMYLELLIPIDYGYTWYLVAQK